MHDLIQLQEKNATRVWWRERENSLLHPVLHGALVSAQFHYWPQASTSNLFVHKWSSNVKNHNQQQLPRASKLSLYESRRRDNPKLLNCQHTRSDINAQIIGRQSVQPACKVMSTWVSFSSDSPQSEGSSTLEQSGLQLFRRWRRFQVVIDASAGIEKFNALGLLSSENLIEIRRIGEELCASLRAELVCVQERKLVSQPANRFINHSTQDQASCLNWLCSSSSTAFHTRRASKWFQHSRTTETSRRQSISTKVLPAYATDHFDSLQTKAHSLFLCRLSVKVSSTIFGVSWRILSSARKDLRARGDYSEVVFDAPVLSSASEKVGHPPGCMKASKQTSDNA